MTAPPALDEPGAVPAPAGRRGLGTKILIGVAALLVLTVGAGVVYGISLDRRVMQNLTRGPNLLPSVDPTATTSPRPAKEPQETGTLNYVLLGSDSRNTEDLSEGRSDTIMVVHLTKKRDKAYVISFPRDMYVTIPGHGKAKINAAFELGGPPLTVQTLEALTRTRMDHVVLADFEGFVQLTEDLGGVTVTNKTSFSSHGYTYPKGKITITGKEALWFVRERHALPGGDLDRAENQRKVIKAIVSKGLSPRVVSDPLKFTTFIAGMAQHLTVDDTLSDSEIRTTALSLRLTGKDIELMQAPLDGFATVNGQSVDVVDTATMNELAVALKNDKVADYLKKHPQG
jgi:LCP family protein required for cell wall assembly